MKNLLFFINYLGSGGAQRQIVELAIGFKERGYNVRFLVYQKEYGDFYYDYLISRGIEIDGVYEKNYFKRILVIRRYLRSHNFDVLIAFLEVASFMSELAVLPSKKWKLIVGERSADPAKRKSIKLRFFLQCHILADYVVANSYANIALAENTYNDSKKRINKQYDRPKDLEKIEAVIQDYHKILIPCFSLGRTQTILTELYNMDLDGKIPNDVHIIIDSPLAQKFCGIWPEEDLWPDIMKWNRLHFTTDWTESQTLMKRNTHDIIISASGFLNGGRVMEWLKCILPNPNNAILFCGYSGENNLAYQIRHGDSVVVVDGEVVENKANIVELVSFSSHASYQELMDYYINELRYDKILLVHGNMDNKVKFANTLQNKLIEQGKSSRVVVTNMDTKIFF